MMKTLIALSLLALPAIANAEVKTQCWDATFGYNYAKIVETSRGTELSITGASLGLPAFYDNFSHSYSFGAFGTGSSPSLHIVLPSKSEVIDGATVWKDNVATVEENGWPQAKYPKLWIRHSVRNLGQWQPIFTDIEVSHVTLKASEKNISISFRQHFAPGNAALETISVNCMMDQVPQYLGLPSEIANLIDAGQNAQSK